MAVHQATTLKVMSLNLAHGRKDRLNQLLVSGDKIRSNLNDIATVLNSENIDVVALQEADAPSRWSGNFDHIALLSKQAGYPVRAHGLHAKNWIYHFGTALLSMLDFREVVRHSFTPTPPTTNKGFTLGQIAWQPESPDKDIRLVDIISVHLDFSRQAVREQQISEIIAILGEREYPVIIMGDFNSDWQADEHTLKAVAEQADLHAYRPEASDMGTYPSSGRRLDWILISRELEFVTHDTMPDTLSDHLAVVAVLRFKQP